MTSGKGEVLRRIFGPIYDGNMWRIRTNKELYDLYGEVNLLTAIKIQRLKWLGHVQRMLDERGPRKALNGKPEGNGDQRRPRLRWMDAVESDLRRLNIKRWRKKAEDRNEWKGICKATKALQGL